MFTLQFTKLKTINFNAYIIIVQDNNTGINIWREGRVNPLFPRLHFKGKQMGKDITLSLPATLLDVKGGEALRH